MRGYISFLRGVNVGGKVLKMGDVVELYRSLGLADVKNYIQSGNVMFNTTKARLAGLEHALQMRIKERLSFDVTLVIRSREQLEVIVGRNPFTKLRGLNGKSLYVTFLAGNVETKHLAIPPAGKNASDEYRLFEAEVYLYCPGGYGKTIYSNAFFEKCLGMSATTRNWNTVTKLLEISGADAS